MSELWEHSATELAGLIRTGETSSAEVLETHLARVDRLDPDVNAVVTLDAERAREAAAAADAEVRSAAGDTADLGPLHGVPMTVKDCFQTAGVRTTGGAPGLDHVPDVDATAVARLRAAGAVIFGKTNLPAYASDAQTYNELFGTTRNPWDPDRSPGGSSGGAAAALAARMTPLELGSDLSGSIRLPAAWTGVCGFKPTWGVAPIRGHVPPAAGRLGRDDVLVAGPLGRTVADLELAFAVLAGSDEPERRAWRLDLPPPPGDRPLRFALWDDPGPFPLAPECRAALADTAAALEEAGHRVDPFHVELDLARLRETAYRLIQAVPGGGLPSEVYAGLAELAADPSDAADDHRRAGAARLTQSHREWLRADERRHHLRRALEAALGGADALLLPPVPVPAIAHQHEGTLIDRQITVAGSAHPYFDLFLWCSVVGALHLPAASVPVGRTAGGLPLAVQVAGPLYGDRTVLAAAAAIEAATPPLPAPL